MTKKNRAKQTADVHIKCKPAEKKAWIKKAEGRDTYLSDWMRWLANKAK